MAIAEDLFIVGFVIVVGLISQFMFKKFRIPAAFFLILFGAVLSYFGLAEGVRQGSDAITFLVVFSLIYVVFYGALPISLRAIFSTLKYALFSSIINLVVITSIIGAISYFMGFSWTLALSIGALFCVLDGSIINSLLEIINVSKKAEAQIQAESAIIDIFVVVVVLSIVNFSMSGFDSIIASLSSYIFLSFGIGIVVAFLWAFALKYVGNFSSAPVATMAVLVMLYAFAEFVRSNGVIAVFVFSITLSNAQIWSRILYKEQREGISVIDLSTKSFFKDISFLIRTFLFVYLGILIDFSMWPYILAGLGFFLLAYMLRSFIMRIVYNKELTHKDINFMDAMCAKGLTPIVMLAAIQGSRPFANIIIGGIFSSVVITSLIVYLVEKERFSSVSDLIIKRISKKRRLSGYGEDKEKAGKKR